MIVGIAVPTIDRSRAASAMAAMTPTVTIAWLRVIGGIGGSAAAARDAVIGTECREGPGSATSRGPDNRGLRASSGRREPRRAAVMRETRDVEPADPGRAARPPPRRPGAGGPALREHPATGRGPDHGLRRIDEVRLPAHPGVRAVDARVREEPVAHADPRRVAGGDLPLDVRDDRPEQVGGVPAEEGGPRLPRAGAGAEAQHGPHPRDPLADARAAPPGRRRPGHGEGGRGRLSAASLSRLA